MGNSSERKRRKKEKRKKDRRSYARRKKDDDDNKELAKAIVALLPKRIVEHINKKFLCDHCQLYYCVGFDGVDEFCRECFFKLGCKKLASGAIKQCNFCKREEANVASKTKH